MFQAPGYDAALKDRALATARLAQLITAATAQIILESVALTTVAAADRCQLAP
jgi:hypothetical protein